MTIYNIRLQNFRSYASDTFEFDAGVNIIVGPNASGKTNLLETILLVAKGSSYRAASQELVQHDKDWARIDAMTSTSERVVKIDGRMEPAKKTFEIDGRIYSRLPAGKLLPAVLFEPEHLRLLSGSPDSRRQFLDDLIEQTVPGYGKLRRDYGRTLAQRNSLLKKSPLIDKSQIFAWNVRLAELGSHVAIARQNLADRLNMALTELYPKLSHDHTHVELEYLPLCAIENYSSLILKRLDEKFELDVVRGYTTSGPHREDFAIKFNGRDVRDVASRGEIRTLLLGLKIAELKLVEEVYAEPPLLLLDDVFSELDGARRHALTKFVKDYQTFITTTDADVVVKQFVRHSKLIAL